MSPTTFIGQQKFASKLTAKLSGLQDTSSKETLQTLAKWIAFHRKHARGSLIEALMGSEVGILNSSRGSRTVSVLNELLLLNRDQPTLWERLADLRVAVGEQLLTAITSAATVDVDAENNASTSGITLTPATMEKLINFLADWDKHNVFGGPTLIHQLKRKLTVNSSSSPVKQSQPAVAVASAEIDTKKEDSTTASVVVIEEAAISSASATNETKEPPITPVAPDNEEAKKKASLLKPTPPETVQDEEIEMEISNDDLLESSSPDDPLPDEMPSPIQETTTPSTTRASASAPPSQYDFESKNIPERTVDPRHFLEPCRAIATLQIARDLRNDNAVQLSALLQTMPEDVRAYTAELAERADADGSAVVVDLDDTCARDFSVRTADQLLDTDLTEAWQNVRTLRDICRQQSAARQQLLDLLIASRCKFGADEVAAAFYAMDADELKRRSQILVDAMELEGLDIAEMEGDTTGTGKKSGSKTTQENLDEELPPLTWYHPGDDADANKRIKVE